MDYTNIIIAGCTAIGTILAIWAMLLRFADNIDKRFDKVDEELRDLNTRLSRVEGMLWRDFTGTNKPH